MWSGIYECSRCQSWSRSMEIHVSSRASRLAVLYIASSPFSQCHPGASHAPRFLFSIKATVFWSCDRIRALAVTCHVKFFRVERSSFSSSWCERSEWRAYSSGNFSWYFSRSTRIYWFRSNISRKIQEIHFPIYKISEILQETGLWRIVHCGIYMRWTQGRTHDFRVSFLLFRLHSKAFFIYCRRLFYSHVYWYAFRIQHTRRSSHSQCKMRSDSWLVGRGFSNYDDDYIDMVFYDGAFPDRRIILLCEPDQSPSTRTCDRDGHRKATLRLRFFSSRKCRNGTWIHLASRMSIFDRVIREPFLTCTWFSLFLDSITSGIRTSSLLGPFMTTFSLARDRLNSTI